METQARRQGFATELIVRARLQELGFNTLVPDGEIKYDIVIEQDGRFLRLQVKTARIYKGSIVAPTCTSSRKNTYEGMIDYFIFYCPQTKDILVLPLQDAPGKEVSFSLSMRKSTSRSTAKFQLNEKSFKEFIR